MFDDLRAGLTIVISIFVFSLVCALGNAKIYETLQPPAALSDPLLLLLSLPLVVLSIPAIVYLSIVSTGADSWMWDNGTDYFLWHIAALLCLIVAIWGTKLWPFIITLTAHVWVAIAPSHAARRFQKNDDANDFKASDAFAGRAAFSRATAKATKEATTKAKLQAELEREIEELEKKKARLDQRNRR